MPNDKQSTSLLPRHKRMAMGETIEHGFKKGGAVKKAVKKAEAKKKKK